MRNQMMRIELDVGTARWILTAASLVMACAVMALHVPGHMSGPVLVMTGNSFSNACLPLFERSFIRIVFSHHQNGFFRPDLIERFKPDAVLLEVIESGIRDAIPPSSLPATAAPRS